METTCYRIKRQKNVNFGWRDMESLLGGDEKNLDLEVW